MSCGCGKKKVKEKPDNYIAKIDRRALEAAKAEEAKIAEQIKSEST